MGILGLIGIIASIYAGYKSGNSDFYIVAGLIFVGTCILELPRMIFYKFQKLIEALQKILNAKKES